MTDSSTTFKIEFGSCRGESRVNYRFTRFFHQNDTLAASSWTWAMLTLSELIFTFVWILTQSFRWRPVIRSALPENLPGDADLPSADVFVCTADSKEPTVEVINTVLSAMPIDYPPEKLAVYLSDDGGSPVTLYAMKEAARFGQSWVPFCSNYGIKTRCPEAYFSSFGDDERVLRVNEFRREEEELEESRDEEERGKSRKPRVVFDRPPRVKREKVAMSLYVVTGLFGITLSFHRHLSHKSFKLPKWLEYLFAYCGAQALQGNPIDWVSTHIFHHQFCDSERDPHSPIERFWFSHMNWIFDKSAFIERCGEPDNAGDLQKQPFTSFFKKPTFFIQLH